MSPGRGAAIAFATSVVLTALMAAPVLRAPRERIFGTGLILGRADPNRDPLVVMDQFRTGRVPPPYLQPVTDLPGRALSRLVGPVGAYNILVLATFPLAAAAAYLLARHGDGSHGGAMVAALAYAFLPFHIAQAGGHPHVAQTQWLPLYLLALWRCADRPGLVRAVLLGAAAAAVSLSSFYSGFVAAVLSPIALAGHALVAPCPPQASRWRNAAITGLVLMAAAAASVVLLAGLAPVVLLHPRSLAFPRPELYVWSARWWSYLMPPADHPALGEWVRAIWTRRGVGPDLLEHQQVSVGLSLLLLAAVPLFSWARGERGSYAARHAVLLAGLGAFALLCSLSPERRLGPLTFVRPSALLYALAPMFRAYSRFGVMVGLAVSLLAGAGAAALWRRPGPAGRLVATILLGMAAFELAPFPPWRWRDVLPTQAHRWLAGQRGALWILDCVEPPRDSDALSLGFVGHPMSLLGPPPLDDCGEPHLADKLGARGYTHVVLRAGTAPDRWLAAHPPADLARGPAFADAAILQVARPQPRVHVEGMLGFYRREYDAATTWRWAAGMGALRITGIPEGTATVLELEMKAFPAARRIDWYLDGRWQGAIDVGAGWRWYALCLPALSRTGVTLTLASSAPAATADDILHNLDRRALSFAVADWRLASSLLCLLKERSLNEAGRTPALSPAVSILSTASSLEQASFAGGEASP